MQSGNKRYWQDLDAARAAARAESGEFAEELPLGTAAAEDDGSRYTRRGFMAVLGLSATTLAACSRSPVGKIVPYLDKPEDVTPGVASHYASTCGACPAQCGILVKTRDARPIKIEGNPEHPLSAGGVCAVGQASVLSLYDAGRARGPSRDGKDVTWAALDEEVGGALKKLEAAGKAIWIVAPAHLGPTAEAALAVFLAAFPRARRVRDGGDDLQAIADAHAATHGLRVVPAYRLDRAEHIVGIGADFLGTWLQPVAFTRQWSSRRDPAARKMSRHTQFEPKISLTGSNADRRHTLAPSDTVPLLGALARALGHGAAGLESIAKIRAPELEPAILAGLAADLASARGASVVLCGSDDPLAQVLTNVVNELCGAYGSTVDLAAGLEQPATMSLEELLAELGKGSAGAVLFWGVNPVFTHPRGADLATLLAKVELTVSLGERRDETGEASRHHAPDHDPLESWGDASPEAGLIGVRQPVVNPLFDTRSACESLLEWAGAPAPHDEFMRSFWEAQVLPAATESAVSFRAFWNRSVAAGFAKVTPKPRAEPHFEITALGAAIGAHSSTAAREEGLELVLYEKVAIRDGKLANNGWLQELPDPISKVTWANYACVSPALAAELGVVEGRMLEVRMKDRAITLPVLIEPGVHRRVVAVALGYGRKAAGKIGNGVGVNASPLGLGEAGRLTRTPRGATAAAAAGSKELAKSQTEASMQGRPIVKEASLGEYLANASAGNEVEGGEDGKKHLTMWSGHAYPGHKWGMSIDLSACTGCSACVVACHAENNVPIVGELEVLRRRDMHWIRIDRYFAGSPEDPSVVHQPMMCQHCENAPCETVCPVLATVHSSEGLNQQVYNRCVGTRYCANNCPPKVRRFNWFDYPHEDPLERMVLNPDVVVRSRGVMEKCSMCVQRIQEGKAVAKHEGRPVRDGDILTACQQSCPARAITFGDANDPGSRLAKLTEDGRHYELLDELGIRPAVGYLTKIKNGEGNHG